MKDFLIRVAALANSCHDIVDPTPIPDLLTACSSLIQLIQSGADPQTLLQSAQAVQVLIDQLTRPNKEIPQK